MKTLDDLKREIFCQTMATTDAVLQIVDHLNDHGYLQLWQPIETAPRDGTRMLLSRTAYECETHPPVITGKWKTRGGWMVTRFKIVDFEPTHWMPLPKPPAQKGDE